MYLDKYIYYMKDSKGLPQHKFDLFRIPNN